MTQERQPSSDFDEAIIRQWTWKTPAMKAMTLAICRLAIERAGAEFSANDLPEFNHGGKGICGSIFSGLIKDGLLSRVGKFEGSTFYPKIVLNPGGNKVGVYRLASASLAKALIDVHGQPEPKLQQQEFPQ